MKVKKRIVFTKVQEWVRTIEEALGSPEEIREKIIASVNALNESAKNPSTLLRRGGWSVEARLCDLPDCLVAPIDIHMIVEFKKEWLTKLEGEALTILADEVLSREPLTGIEGKFTFHTLSFKYSIQDIDATTQEAGMVLS